MNGTLFENILHCGPPFAWGASVEIRSSLFVRYLLSASREDIPFSSSTTPCNVPISKSSAVCFCAFQSVMRSCIFFAAVTAGSASVGSAIASLIILLARFVDAMSSLRWLTIRAKPSTLVGFCVYFSPCPSTVPSTSSILWHSFLSWLAMTQKVRVLVCQECAKENRHWTENCPHAIEVWKEGYKSALQ